MKTFQCLSAAVVLTFAFTLSTFAGDMDCGIAPPLPPPPTSSLMQGDAQISSGHMSTGAGATTTASESYTEVVWGLLEGVLVLF